MGGFPQGGSFSLRQLDALKSKLVQIEKDNNRKKRKDRMMVNWTALNMWKSEAEK